MDLFVRKINLQFRKREYVPLESSIEASRRAFINEISFTLFGKLMTDGNASELTAVRFVPIAVASARDIICRMENIRADAIPDPDENEKQEYLVQAKRLYEFFRRVSDGRNVEMWPRFVGCGIIDTCYGDVYCDGTLFEVKAGERTFRSVDVRQLLTYAALNKSAGTRNLNRLGLFNPRTGVSWSDALEEVCLEVAGRPSGDFLSEIIRVISSGDTSR